MARDLLPLEYPIQVDLEYRLCRLGEVVQAGTGRTARLSCSSVAFDTQDRLQPGGTVELFIAWPARLNNAVGLQLWIRGRTMHSADSHTVVEILRYNFRTRRAGSFGARDDRASSRAIAAIA
jgi:hypothetical protein